MTQTGEWRLPRVSAGRLMGEALQTPLAAAWSLWWIWLLWTGANLGLLLALSTSLRPHPLWFVSAAALSFAVSLVNGFASGVCTRTYLRGPSGRWRLDGGLALYVGFTVVQGVLQTGLPLLTAIALSVASFGRLPTDPAMIQGTQSWIGLVVLLALFWPSARLMLWPVGGLVGDQRTTLTFSWRAMRGAVWAYLLSYLLLGAAPFAAYSLGWTSFVAFRNSANLAVAAVGFTLLAVVASSLRAVVYRTRLGPGAERLADVFD